MKIKTQYMHNISNIYFYFNNNIAFILTLNSINMISQSEDTSGSKMLI